MNPSQLFRPRPTKVSPRPARKLGFDNLEVRAVLSTVATSLAHVHALATPTVTTTVKTLSGTITNETNGRALRGVRVELLDSNGRIARETFTNARGNYTFLVRNTGAYVVREVTPRGFTQVAPTFASTAPVGAYAPGRGASSWNYRTGNNNPANGPVGPASWATIAPAGTLPFESPINLTGPTIDLSRVLSINYNPAVPRAIVNNGSQIQTQFSTTAGADTITLGGQTFALSNFHYHVPGENQVIGTTYPMEEHFVNVSAAGATTVLAVFLQEGAHNNALDPILNAATASLTRSGSSTTIATPIDFAGLLPTSAQGYYYQGSLTTPPLSQVVNWLVFATPITLDAAQLAQSEAVANAAGFLPNARPRQPLDGRQLNEVDIDLNVQNSMHGLNFGLAKTSTLAGQGTSLGSSRVIPGTTTLSTANASNSANSAQTTVSAQSLLAQASTTATSTVSAEAAAQGYQPVAGCNCPLCQMLRNAVWTQVTTV